ncbi:MAG TPA: DNA polymerase III subunit beta [Anaeromyxobacteraceae bacterium]|nr:DNA polymerase III subunit beta [Anaeromyxobacteraceae bacterium]
MELKIAVQELSRALARSQGIVEKKSTMPILSHVLLEARKSGELAVSATDLDVSVSGVHAAEVTREGGVAVSARHLFDIVKALPEATVSLKKAQNNYLEVRSGPADFRIVGLPAEDFPALPKFEKVPFVGVDPGVILALIERTAFAVSSDETRYNLNGVYFEPSAGAIRLVATDGHRLSMADAPVDGDFKLKKGVILPKKGIFELRKLLGEVLEGSEEKPKGELGFAENSAIFRRPGVVLVMRLIEGSFPDYRQVVPKAGEKVLVVGRERLLQTLRRVSLLSSEKSNAVKLEVTKANLRIAAQNPDLGEAKEDVPLEYDGEGLKIGFNARYLTDVLSVLPTDDVRLELADDLSPGVLRPKGEAEEHFTAVIMPMRI